jgi:hypothetical protein
VNLIAVGVEAQPLPEAGLLHVGVDVKLEHAVILAALIEASPIVERLAVIGAADADAGSCQRRACARDVELESGILGKAVRRVGHFAGGVCRDRRRQAHQ